MKWDENDVNVNDMNMNIEVEKELNLKWNEMYWDLNEMIDYEI